MAEELTSNAAPAVPSGDSGPIETGQSTEQAPRESAEPQSTTEHDTAPESTGAGKPKQGSGVNLYEIPEFRQYQSQMTRQQQDMQRRMQQLEQQAAARIQELEDAGLDDYEKAQRRAERAEQKLAAYQQQVYQQQQQDEANRRILDDMQRIAKMTEIPIEELFTAPTYDDAWEMGIAYMKKQGATKAEQQEVQREANRTIVGGGRASTSTDRTERALQKAMEDGDAAGYIRLLREQRAG